MVFLGTFFTWSSEDTTAMIGVMSDLFDDLTPLLIIILGIGMGLIVVGAILRAIRG